LSRRAADRQDGLAEHPTRPYRFTL
jgi:hypothetical protein